MKCQALEPGKDLHSNSSESLLTSYSPDGPFPSVIKQHHLSGWKSLQGWRCLFSPLAQAHQCPLGKASHTVKTHQARAVSVKKNGSPAQWNRLQHRRPNHKNWKIEATWCNQGHRGRGGRSSKRSRHACNRKRQTNHGDETCPQMQGCPLLLIKESIYLKPVCRVGVPLSCLRNDHQSLKLKSGHKHFRNLPTPLPFLSGVVLLLSLFFWVYTM